MNSDQREVVDRLARIETKLDSLIDVKKDHEDRLRKVESKTGKWAGSAFVLWPVVVAILQTVVKDHLK